MHSYVNYVNKPWWWSISHRLYSLRTPIVLPKTQQFMTYFWTNTAIPQCSFVGILLYAVISYPLIRYFEWCDLRISQNAMLELRTKTYTLISCVLFNLLKTHIFYRIRNKIHENHHIPFLLWSQVILWLPIKIQKHIIDYCSRVDNNVKIEEDTFKIRTKKKTNSQHISWENNLLEVFEIKF